MEATYEPKIVALVCNWCTYTGADLAGTSRTQYASNVRIIKLPCTGRISPMFVLRALAQGADGVLVSGCHPGDCHYTAGNYHARRKFTVLRELLLFLGIEPERVQFSWVSAAEGKKWADVVNAVVADVRKLGPRKAAWGEPVGTAQPVVLGGSLPDGSDRTDQSDSAQARALRAKARELLESGAVNVVVGYQAGSLPGLMRAVFVTDPARVDQLEWNADCRQNLSVYLTRDAVKKLGKIGLVVKACDVKSVVGLIQENQVAREDVVLIGMACRGVQVDGAPAARCAACDGKGLELADHVIGEGAPEPMADPRLEEIARLDAMSPEERWNFWQAQFAQCLRCYACRAACPMCACDRCLAEKTQPAWIPGTIDGRGNLTWHAARALHLAGRCVDCGACIAACPANIRLDLLNLKMAMVVRDRFGYVPGLDPEATPALASFHETDAQEFIR
ncbi:MAG: hydrogenase iron-sulfur subunit [Armatimonadetes bacterium]|nr:hydrogenase iron-sulfur subunit [Armatimonadota bacterium]